MVVDSEIIALYWKRDEEALQETEAAYGSRLHVLADQILRCREDAQECVSDTYLRAWEVIPPQKPVYLFAFLAKICRNLALDVLDRRNAAKRSARIVTLTLELEQCIPDPAVEKHLEGQELGQLLNRFLEGLSRENRRIFLRRYWYADTILQIAERYQISESKVKTQLHRTREKLRQFLQKEGIDV